MKYGVAEGKYGVGGSVVPAEGAMLPIRQNCAIQRGLRWLHMHYTGYGVNVVPIEHPLAATVKRQTL